MIRKLEEKDIDEVIAIWLETNIKTHNYIPEHYWKDNLDNVKSEIAKADTYVYEENSKIKGFIGIQKGYIAGIFVKEDMQNRGIGKQLISKCKQNYEKLTLNVYKKNEKAINFYINQGFSIEEECEDKETGEIEILMTWKNNY